MPVWLCTGYVHVSAHTTEGQKRAHWVPWSCRWLWNFWPKCWGVEFALNSSATSLAPTSSDVFLILWQHVQAGFKLPMWPRMTLYFWSFSLYLQSSGIVGMHQHAQFIPGWDQTLDFSFHTKKHSIIWIMPPTCYLYDYEATVIQTIVPTPISGYFPFPHKGKISKVFGGYA